MKFHPDHPWRIADEETFPTAIQEMTAALEQVRVCGTYTAFDGVKIYYEYFLAENSKGSVVIVHGLSEFTQKFYEMIYYTLQQGYNVFVYDQRCHGLSDRLTEKPTLLHVDDFEDYVKDLSQFVDEIVLKTEDKPLYLYSHSMGGAVAALYLSKCSHKIQKAVLSAPMFEPIVKQVPVPIARMGVAVGSVFYGKKTQFPLSDEFKSDVQFNPAYGTSRARFEHYMTLRREHAEFQSSPMSFGWVNGSLTVGKKILRRKTLRGISTPILLISAERDTMVNNAPQHKFAKRYAGCELVTMAGETHALLASDVATMTRMMDLTFSFFAAP